MLAEGKSVKEIASGFDLSVKTIEAHKFNLMRKLDIHNKAQLVQYAIQKKILRLPGRYRCDAVSRAALGRAVLAAVRGEELVTVGKRHPHDGVVGGFGDFQELGLEAFLFDGLRHCASGLHGARAVF